MQSIDGTRIAEADKFRFWSKVGFQRLDECWPWKRSGHKRGYGMFKLNRRHLIASRVAMAIAVGFVPEDRFVCHHCDNPKCCNPAHLFLATAKENTADMIAKGRGRFMPCDSSHFNIGKWRAKHMPFAGSLHPAAKLTEETVKRIRLALNNGVSGKDCAAAFGCSTYTVSNIKLRKQWRHV